MHESYRKQDGYIGVITYTRTDPNLSTSTSNGTSKCIQHIQNTWGGGEGREFGPHHTKHGFPRPMLSFYRILLGGQSEPGMMSLSS